MKGIKLLKDTVVFIPLDQEEDEKEKRTAGGLYLPDDIVNANKAKTFKRGEVVSFGVNCEYVKHGSIIHYSPGSAHAAKLNGEMIMMIMEDSIFGVDED